MTGLATGSAELPEQNAIPRSARRAQSRVSDSTDTARERALVGDDVVFTNPPLPWERQGRQVEIPHRRASVLCAAWLEVDAPPSNRHHQPTTKEHP